MNKKIKKELISYGLMALIAALLYATGLHTPLISYLQRGLLATGLVRPNTEKAKEKTGTARPNIDLNIKLIDAEGQLVNMQQFRDKVLFINVWATWCPPCLAEMPNIDQLYRDLEGDDVVFIMLSVDQDFSKAVNHVSEKGFRFPVYQIGEGWPASLNSSTIPTTYVIDRMGTLVLEHRGMAKYNTKEFKAFLQELMDLPTSF